MVSPFLKHTPVDRLLKVATGPLGALLIALSVAVLCGIFVDARGLAFAGALGLTLAFGLVYPWLAVFCLSGTARFEVARMSEGEDATVQIRLRNRAPFAIWGIRFAGFLPASDTETEQTEPDVPLTIAKGEQMLRWTLPALPRGQYPQAIPQISCSFPFGLIQARRPLECGSELLVWPRIIPVPEIPDGDGEWMRDGIVESRKPGHDGDLMGVRDFRRGDSLRRVHWAQSARHDRLIVIERHALRSPRIHLILDLSGAPGGVDSPREQAIRMIASLIEEWGKQGVELTLMVRDRQSQEYSGARRHLLDTLARLPRSVAPCEENTPTGTHPRRQVVPGRMFSVAVTTTASLTGVSATYVYIADAPDFSLSARPTHSPSRTQGLPGTDQTRPGASWTANERLSHV